MNNINNNVLFSIHPKWTYKILIETKTIEIRKTIPKINLPFTGYIYCTKDKKYPLSLGPFGPVLMTTDDMLYDMQGKIVAKFTCNEIREFVWDEYNYCYDIDDDSLRQSKLTQEELKSYGKGKTLYGIVISNITTYLEPKSLSSANIICHNYTQDMNSLHCINCPDWCHYQPYDHEEYRWCNKDGKKELIRPPQSWQYINEVIDEVPLYKYYEDPEFQRLVEELFT